MQARRVSRVRLLRFPPELPVLCVHRAAVTMTVILERRARDARTVLIRRPMQRSALAARLD